MNLEVLENQLRTVVTELLAAAQLKPKQILVIGTSTSEVLGEKIGTAGNEQVAEIIYRVVKEAQAATGFQLAFQCCEHLNRALVVERETADHYRLEEVSVIPVPKAGGSMAAYAYRQMQEPVMAESIRAHAGIDIGDTFIGMHLRPVAVPVRPSIRQIGFGHVTMALTRPRLVGGSRAVYERTDANFSCYGSLEQSKKEIKERNDDV